MLTIKELTTEVYHLKFKDDDEMIMHFIRFSEYYESADKNLYRSKFTMDEALDHYKQNRGKTYFDGVGAFNLPVSIMSKMASEYGNSLTDREKFIMSLVYNIRTVSEGTLKYLIITSGKDDEPDEIQHEISHALYYIDPAYRLKMDSLTRLLPKRVKQELYKFLEHEQYNQSVYDDELQSYMATGFDYDEQQVVNLRLINMFRSGYCDVFMEALSAYGITL